MMIILNSVLPVFSVIGLGAILRRCGLTGQEFLKTSDRLIYFIFFPAMLFWKISTPGDGEELNWELNVAALAAVFVVWAFNLLYAKLAHVPEVKVGSLSQCSYRFNTYVGMAIILEALGEEGGRLFGVMIGFAIPFINVLAVSTLIWHSGRDYTLREKIPIILKAMLSNPLILACVAGILYARLAPPLPTFISNALRLLSLISLPMALISIGGSLTFKMLRGHLALASVATLFKLLLLPLVGYALLRTLGVTGDAFQVAMIFFTLPTSTASYVLSSQLGSDVDLASASIVLSTLLSFVSLSLAMILFLQ